MRYDEEEPRWEVPEWCTAGKDPRACYPNRICKFCNQTKSAQRRIAEFKRQYPTLESWQESRRKRRY